MFAETALIENAIDPLTNGQLAAGMVPRDGIVTALAARKRLTALDFIDIFFPAHVCSLAIYAPLTGKPVALPLFCVSNCRRLTESRLRAMRNIFSLTAASFFGSWGQMVIAILAGIVGAEIAPSLALATLPVTTALLGTASATVPAALLMKRIGRRLGMQIAAGVAACGALLAAWAVANLSFAIFCGATFLLGGFMAFHAQLRFAAAESLPPEKAGLAISLVMTGTLLAALVVPRMVVLMNGAWFASEHAAMFVVVCAAYGFVALLMSGFKEVSQSDYAADGQARPPAVLLRQPLLWAALLSSLTGFAVMNLVMTATPVSMHVYDGHSLADTAFVIQSHVLAMFTPSLFSGWLVSRLGTRVMIAAGLLFEAACVAVAMSGQTVGHYWAALLLLGIGWNFLFVSGSTLLTRTYRTSERFKVQAINEFAVFGSMAIASLLAGALLSKAGWFVLNVSAAAVLLLAAITIATLLRPSESR
jgi:MFS family permease